MDVVPATDGGCAVVGVRVSTVPVFEMALKWVTLRLNLCKRL